MSNKRTNSERRDRLRKDVAKRLLMVREVMGLQQAEFGRRAGLAANTYNMIEKGERLPSIEVALDLCDAHGLTLEYIFRGDPGDLRHSLAVALEAVTQAALIPPTTRFNRSLSTRNRNLHDQCIFALDAFTRCEYDSQYHRGGIVHPRQSEPLSPSPRRSGDHRQPRSTAGGG